MATTDKKKPIVYDIGINSKEGDFVDTVSLVEKPAIEQDFVWFSDSKKKPLFKFTSDDEKRIVLGAALVPNKLIPRRDDYDQTYFVRFSKESIENIVVQAAKYGKIWVNIEHWQYTDGAWIFESWIKTKENDKSNEYGFQSLPVGTWFISMKIYSEELWQQVKAGELRGFSIEGFLSLVESNIKFKSMFSSKTKKKAADGKQAFMSAMGKTFDKALEYSKSEKFESFAVLENGAQVFEYNGIWLITSPENADVLEVAPDGEHTLENGETIVIEDGVLVTEEDMSEDEKDDEQEETEQSEVSQEAIAQTVQDAVKSAVEPLTKQLSDLSKEFGEFKSSVEEDMGNIEQEFKKTLEPDKKNAQPKKKKLSKESDKDLTPKQKAKLEEDRMFARIANGG